MSYNDYNTNDPLPMSNPNEISMSNLTPMKRRQFQDQLNISKSPNGYTPVSPSPKNYEQDEENIPPSYNESSAFNHFNEALPQS